jgi:hypothetical protein
MAKKKGRLGKLTMLPAITKQGKWFKDHGMKSIGLHGETYKAFDRFRKAKSREMGVTLSWNEFVLVIMERGLDK